MGPLKEQLLDKEWFTQISNYFVEQTVADTIQAIPDFKNPKSMEIGLSILADENAAVVFSCSESPIETIFLNSLSLLMIKNSIAFLIMPTVPDATMFITEMREQLGKLREFTTWYEARNADYSGIYDYFDDQVERGIMPAEERPGILRWILYYEWLHFRDCIHVILQAGLPCVKVGGKGIRADLYFWVPSNDKYKLIVECDGFQFHADRKTFVTDRQRDRALSAAGFQCLRFSGSEINADPVKAADEMFDFLSNWIK